MALEPHLRQCGYAPKLLLRDFTFSAGDGEASVPLAAFAHTPADARSACIAVVEDSGAGMDVRHYRDLGAPVVFVCERATVHWWKQGSDAAELIDTIQARHLGNFFEQHATALAPESVYRAKTRGNFEREYQLQFVDAGLLPIVEADLGERLQALVESLVGEVVEETRPRTAHDEHTVLQSVFWLIAAKILKDKRVPAFSSVDLLDIGRTFSAVSAHYGSATPLGARRPATRQALDRAAARVARFSSLGQVTTEALAQVYEDALVSRETRAALGTHSTPSFLVDYVLARVAPWVQSIPSDERRVLEPACGHAAFLVAAMRLLRDLFPGRRKAPHAYLQQRLHGIEIDAFAREIARLSLTLADIPNPNGWNLVQADIFAPQVLERAARRATVLLANPPFEHFSDAERKKYAAQGVPPTHKTKSTELLSRCLPHLRPGSVFGIVLPQSFLKQPDATAMRRFIVQRYELSEIALFPDKLFERSDSESVLLIGRRSAQPSAATKIAYKRVREQGLTHFRLHFVTGSEQTVDQARFATSADANFLIPDLDEVWRQPFPATLHDIVTSGQGLFYKGEAARGRALTVSDHPFPGAVKGFDRIGSELKIHSTPDEVWMSIDDAVVDRWVKGKPGAPQVLVNYAPVSRGPWRLKAVLDPEGHAVTSRFIALRPRNTDLPLECVWALMNSPLANAYAYTHGGKRDITVGLIRRLPVPRLTSARAETLARAARSYIEAARSGAGERDVIRRLVVMDAEVLKTYELAPRLERQLLDLFSGHRRPGIPAQFTDYYPPDFESFIPLWMLSSGEFHRTDIQHFVEGARNAPESLRAALRVATDAFREP